MPTVIVTGSGGLIGSESVAHFVRSGIPGPRHRERHASSLLRRLGLDLAHTTDRLVERIRRARSESLSMATSATADRDRLSTVQPNTRGTSSSSSTPPPSRRTTGRRRDPLTDFAVNANGTLNLLQATRDPRPLGDVRVLLDQQGLRRPPQRTAARRAPSSEARACPTESRCTSRGHRHLDVDRPLDAFVVRRLQSRRGPARPGVRQLLRHADCVLPRRLPDRTQPRGHPAARLPLLPDALRDVRRPRTRCSATGASRCATTSMRPTSSPRSTPSIAAPRPAAVYNIGGGRRQQLLDARGNRRM